MPTDLLGQHQVRESIDGIERSAQLVGHVGEELALEFGGPLQLAVLRLQRPLARRDSASIWARSIPTTTWSPSVFSSSRSFSPKERPSFRLCTPTVPMVRPPD